MFVTIAFGSGGNLYFSNRNRYTYYAQCQTFWKHKLAIMHFLNFIFLFSSPNNLLIGCSLRDMDVLRTEGSLVRRYTRGHSSSNWIKWFAAHSFYRVNWGRRRRRRARAKIGYGPVKEDRGRGSVEALPPCERGRLPFPLSSWIYRLLIKLYARKEGRASESFTLRFGF